MKEYKIKHFTRIYHDFLMPSQLDKWKTLLSFAKRKGYEFIPIRDFIVRIKESSFVASNRKYFIVRHDVDSGLSILRNMWLIEKQMGVKSTYYFRLSTVDVPLMKDIESCGSEASYHYEELATYAKRKGLMSRVDITEHMEEIKALFKKNIYWLRRITGLSMITVASHGDFINRKLGVINHEILKDVAFMNECNIDFEAYDENFIRFITNRYSDSLTSAFWFTSSLFDAIMRNESVIYCLVHPNNWGSDFFENFINNLWRLYEEFSWFSKKIFRGKGTP
jgi:hypothetical protein